MPAFLFAVVFLASFPSYAAAPSFTAQATPPQVVLSPSQRQAMGLPNFPDTSPSIFWNGYDYEFFAAQGEADTSPLSGTVRLVGSLDAPQVNPQNSLGQPVPSIRPGILEPVPGTNFDLNYAGGGATYFDQPTQTLLQSYHGEFDLGHPPSSATFYTTLGLAISHDMGATFQKVGPYISPNLPASAGRTAASSAGSFVVQGEYIYVYYSDIDSNPTILCGKVPCVAIARAPLRSVIRAAQNGQTTPWLKYFQGSFSEPGLGGRFTPLFVPSNGVYWARWPQVAFDQYTQSYIMTYAAGVSGGITLRESKDGIDWSDPLYILPATAGHNVNYPGVISPVDESVSLPRSPLVSSGTYSSFLQKQFWVYYRDYPNLTVTATASANSNWDRILVTLEKPTFQTPVAYGGEVHAEKMVDRPIAK